MMKSVLVVASATMLLLTPALAQSGAPASPNGKSDTMPSGSMKSGDMKKGDMKGDTMMKAQPASPGSATKTGGASGSPDKS